MNLLHSSFEFRPNFLDLGSIRMHYLDEGAGDPVLMLHGNPTWSFMYRRLAADLRRDFRVVVPDHIGCGLSSKPSDKDYSYTMSRRVEDLEALLDFLEVGHKITLVLHDWGGLIGCCLAGRYPERISRLIIFNTAAFHVPAGKSLHWSIRLCRRSRLAALLIRGINLFAVVASHVGCRRNPMLPEVRRGYLAPYDTWANRIAILRFIQDIPLSSRDPSYEILDQTDRNLSRLTGKPLLICWGDRDFVFDDDFRDEWLRRFPAADLHRFPAAGHYVLEDAYEEISPLVRSFLNRAEA